MMDINSLTTTYLSSTSNTTALYMYLKDKTYDNLKGFIVEITGILNSRLSSICEISEPYSNMYSKALYSKKLSDYKLNLDFRDKNFIVTFELSAFSHIDIDDSKGFAKLVRNMSNFVENIADPLYRIPRNMFCNFTYDTILHLSEYKIDDSEVTCSKEDFTDMKSVRNLHIVLENIRRLHITKSKIVVTPKCRIYLDGDIDVEFDKGYAIDTKDENLILVTLIDLMAIDFSIIKKHVIRQDELSLNEYLSSRTIGKTKLNVLYINSECAYFYITTKKSVSMVGFSLVILKDIVSPTEKAFKHRFVQLFTEALLKSLDAPKTKVPTLISTDVGNSMIITGITYIPSVNTVTFILHNARDIQNNNGIQPLGILTAKLQKNMKENLKQTLLCLISSSSTYSYLETTIEKEEIGFIVNTETTNIACAFNGSLLIPLTVELTQTLKNYLSNNLV